MKPYIGIVHQDAETAFGITFPDAPGCFAASDTLDEIFIKAGEALELWVEAVTAEGVTVPRTRDLSALRADTDWAASFADAALVIAVPLPELTLSEAA